ncbi:MAG: AAA family ATPase, partial [Verrucomicrobia bacterium]|nr:AAA family ATPase [Verrucomicrobiota bacterium]
MIEFSKCRSETLRADEEFALYRLWRNDGRSTVLILTPVRDSPSPESLTRLEHEYSLRGELDAEWAAVPLALNRDQGQTMLVLKDPDPRVTGLDSLLGSPMELGRFLRLASNMATGLDKLHRRRLVHKDIKPSHILVDGATDAVWFTGFGISSRSVREKQIAGPPEVIAGTLAYMSPEQTGRLNGSIDSRSDLYSLGVTFYQMLTGSLPFTASEPMEWVHCHIAKQPRSPSERIPGLPDTISAIILKLLSKSAEERYQTTAGLAADLRKCLLAWESVGRIEALPIGLHDLPDRLLIPQRLYGRSVEFHKLVDAFERVAANGNPELVLVSGYSGIGKSSVVNELHKVLAPQALFAACKFDQYGRDIPYSTLAQAFQSLARSLLAKSDTELAGWRDALLKALGLNGQLIIDIVPELKLIIGEQSPVPELPPQDSLRRFQLVFRRFIDIFARPEHPLVLFLDDLQWIDTATLDLLEDMLTSSGLQHLLLIGAIRDNEVTASHSLMRKRQSIKGAGGNVVEIELAPLSREHVGQLIADSLRCPPEEAAPLSQLVYEKTGGNPFFTIQFISTLAEEGLLRFDHHYGRWSWDLDRIHAKGYTDNVVDLMVGKLNRLSPETQDVLQQFACIGNFADVTALTVVLRKPQEQVHSELLEALHQELVVAVRLSTSLLKHSKTPLHQPSKAEHNDSTELAEVSSEIAFAPVASGSVGRGNGKDGRNREPPRQNGYRFVHDRVREAAYSLIPEEVRAAAHLRIGRLLLENTPPENREGTIFEIVSQLNRGAQLISSAAERELLAELNLTASKRAMASAAYSAALQYLTTAEALLPGEAAEQYSELAFRIEFHRAECEFLTGDLESAERRLYRLSGCARNLADLTAVTCLRINLFVTLDQCDRAVQVGLGYLRSRGINWSAHLTKDQIRPEFQRIWQQLGSRSIKELIELPLLADAGLLAKMDVLTALLPPALFTDENLFCLIVAHMANVSLEYGNTDGSCLAYVWLGLLLGPHFGDYPAAFEFGQLGIDLVEKRGLDRFRARVYLDFSHVVNPWMKHARFGPVLVRRAFDAANEIGDLTFAAYSGCNLVSALLATGDPLADLQQEAEEHLQFARMARFGLIDDIITGQLRLILVLRGLTPSFFSFDGDEFNEAEFERRLTEDSGSAVALGWYWVRKLQGRFFAGDHLGAIGAAEKVEQLLWTIPSHLEVAEFHFYAALSRAAYYDTAPEDARFPLLDAVYTHHTKLTDWAEHCPENFENRAALVGAEIARIEGRQLDAERLYEQAIRSAETNAFVHHEALACELAACFYAGRRLEDIAQLYLRKARYWYLRWGANGKVRQLDEMHPNLRSEEVAAIPKGTIEVPIDQLELATVVKASQAVSTEIVFEKLIETLLKVALEHAGAERGLLILLQGEQYRIEAEIRVRGGRRAQGSSESTDDFSDSDSEAGDQVQLQLRDAPITSSELPESLFRYVIRTQQKIILDDASAGVQPRHRNERERMGMSGNAGTERGRSLAAAGSGSDREHSAAQPGDVANLFSNDEYLRLRRPRSVLCLPLIKQSKMIGVLYLENNLAPRVFTQKQLTMLELLASQAAISLDHARMYAELAQENNERKRAEEDLRRSEAYLAQGQKISHTGSWSWRPSTGENYWSEETFRIFGCDTTIFNPSYSLFIERVHPEDRRSFEEHLERAVREKRDFEFEYRIVLPDGSLKFLRSVGQPQVNTSGELEYIGAVVDITESKRAEERQRYHMELLKTVTDNASSMLYIVDAAGFGTFVNPAFERITGYRAEEVIGQIVHDKIHHTKPDGTPYPVDECPLSGAARKGKMVQGEDLYVRKDNTFFPVRYTACPIFRDGVAFATVIEVQDLTESKASEEALRQVQAQLVHVTRVASMGELMTSIAHEINQPLGAIANNASACVRWLGLQNLEEARRSASLVITDAHRAGEIIRGIRALAGKAPLQKRWLDVNGMISEVVALAHEELKRSGVILKTGLAKDLPKVLGDRIYLQQLILNLVINSIEAMSGVSDGRRELWIRSEKLAATPDHSGEVATERQTTNADMSGRALAKPEPAYVLVSVADSGPGLDLNNLDRLFEAFYTTKPQGLGMG